MIQCHSTSDSETLALGRRLSGLLQAGDVVLLEGSLGCGKTRFVAGVAEGLGVDRRVTSPSFVIVQEYDGFIPIVHADVYRLGSTGEFADLQLPDLAREGVLLIEWGDAVEQSVPSDHLVVRFEITGESERTITFIPRGSWGNRSLGDVVAA
ncbi:MAG: tRNA (adenosine(37)-N6)-threonylcarbamoyltransferase complex ATPase subunit type 1 TsaE [Acidimicrobiia bacterium]|nr:tRNA (adenosine(37)-N6)-threonylcarbamoyltransferase complex ATPase subunit type 1 TsaE [Acidimicrobiia bacterium]NNC74326.1 tRNA (adenosine(37)-N6)-threonylcarbamoyltransferase complex ATPase subunit type 1 TsaE [Acidimicrobiia bacterium]